MKIKDYIEEEIHFKLFVYEYRGKHKATYKAYIIHNGEEMTIGEDNTPENLIFNCYSAQEVEECGY